jgi:uncharacterized protein YndB with AHSA1/START domain
MTTIPIQFLVAMSLCGANGTQQSDKTLADSEAMLNLATATQPLVHFATVNAPIKTVWDSYTTTKGIKSWMVPEGTIDLRIGGLMRSSYTKGSDLTGKDVIENKIISYDPEHMLTIQTVKFPDGFPFKNAILKVWTVLYFEPVGEKQTKVSCRMLGWDGTDESTQMRKFFMRGNQQELDALVKHFGKK